MLSVLIIKDQGTHTFVLCCLTLKKKGRKEVDGSGPLGWRVLGEVSVKLSCDIHTVCSLYMNVIIFKNWTSRLLEKASEFKKKKCNAVPD